MCDHVQVLHLCAHPSPPLHPLHLPLSSLPSPAPSLRVPTQSGRRDEDHEYGEAAQDDPHHSEPDGRPPRFQCEFEMKPLVALRAHLECADCAEAAANKVEMRYLRSHTEALFFCVNKIAVEELEDKRVG